MPGVEWFARPSKAMRLRHATEEGWYKVCREMLRSSPTDLESCARVDISPTLFDARD